MKSTKKTFGVPLRLTSEKEPDVQGESSMPRPVAVPLTLQKQKVPVRLPGPGEVVVRLAWTGLCSSVRLSRASCHYHSLIEPWDIYFSTDRDATYCEHNHVSGHEGIGHIVQSHDASQLSQPVGMSFLT